MPEGTSGQICGEIMLNPVFQPQLDTAIVSGKKTLQRCGAAGGRLGCRGGAAWCCPCPRPAAAPASPLPSLAFPGASPCHQRCHAARPTAPARSWKHGVRSALNAFPMFQKTGAVRDGEVVWLLDEACLQAEQQAQAAVRAGGHAGRACLLLMPAACCRA